jgi:probable HAF family extracellular repeat protein
MADRAGWLHPATLGRTVARRRSWGVGVLVVAAPLLVVGPRTGDAAISSAVTAPATTLTATSRDLGTLGGRNSQATAIEGNLVIGRAQTADGDYHAFVYDLGAENAHMRDLGTLSDDTDSVATAVNGPLIVGGSYYEDPHGRSAIHEPAQHAFVYDLSAAAPTMRDLGNLGGNGNLLGTAAFADDVSGNVVVGSSTSTDGAYHGYAYDLGAATPTMRDLGVISQYEFYPSRLLVERNIVVAKSSTAVSIGDSTDGRAFTYDLAAAGATRRYLGSLGRGGSEATAVDRGIIVGSASTRTRPHAFAYNRRATRPAMRDLGSLRRLAASGATAVSGDHVVGWSDLDRAGNYERRHAFVYDLGAARVRMRDLGTTGGTYSSASGVDGNLVVGTSARAGDGCWRAFGYDLGAPRQTMADLGTLGGCSGSVVAVDGRIAVGSSTTPAGAEHASAWTVSRSTAPVLGFDRAHSWVQENTSQARLTVTRAGNLSRPVSVHYATTALVPDQLGDVDGSGVPAEPGRDFTATSGTLRFAAGQTRRSFSVPVRNDRVPEGRETLLVTLDAPTGGAVLGAPNAAAINIGPSDQRPDAEVSTDPVSGYVGDDVYNTTGAGQTRTAAAHHARTRTFYVRIYNDGTTANVITVHGSASRAGSTVRYSTRTDITRAMRSRHGVRFTIGRRGHRTIKVRITVGATASAGSLQPAAVTATWTGDGLRRDRVRAQVRVM